MSNLFANISKKSLIYILISSIFYWGISYGIDRTAFLSLISMYTICFVLFLLLIKENRNNSNELFYIGLFFRVILLFSIPNLSDDFYRFIWDGRLSFLGLNPYLYLPENNTDLVAEGAFLYSGMGTMNGSHYTCYPPINQLSFLIPALFFSKSYVGATIVMRVLIILADIGTFIFGKKIVQLLKLPVKNIYYYFLNPFVILELTGNLHFEGVMIFFLALSLYYIIKNKWGRSALFFAISVSVKLIPLLFLPVFIKKLGVKKIFLFVVLVLLLNVLFFVPFMSVELYDNFMKSIHLYFQNFEFNASIYYVIRAIGFQVKGYNIIHSVGKVTPIIIVVLVLILSFVRNNKESKTMIVTMLFSICIYYSFASIVHPWYIAIPLFLSIFTNYTFPLVWSFLVILSYAAYQDTTYQENLYLVAVEYVIVYATAFLELIKSKRFIELKQRFLV